MILSFANFTAHQNDKEMLTKEKPLSVKEQIKLNPEKVLRDWLIVSKFRFIPRGIYHHDTICEVVKMHVPELCLENTKSRNTDTEYGQLLWRNHIQWAYQQLKGDVVKKVNENTHDGLWGFHLD
jgi:hypothetical protein